MYRVLLKAAFTLYANLFTKGHFESVTEGKMKISGRYLLCLANGRGGTTLKL